MIINDYLKDLEVQAFRKESKIKIAGNSTVDSLCKKYELATKKISVLNINHTLSDSYNVCKNILEDKVYTSKDLANFLSEIKKYENQNRFDIDSGFFLSALINSCIEEKVEIVTAHLSKPISYLGYQSEKDIIVKGNLGSCIGAEMNCERTIHVNGSVFVNLGYKMRKGSIIVEKNADSCVGSEAEGGVIHVKGNADYFSGSKLNGAKVVIDGSVNAYAGRGLKKGLLVINGNARLWTGWYMKGGVIKVKGSTGIFTGLESSGGEIHVEGEIESISSDCKAKIYHKGELVWPK